MANKHKINFNLLNLNNLSNVRYLDKTDENLARYLRDVRKKKRLTQDEEQDIIFKIKNNDPDSEYLKTKLICSHQPFIIMIAKRYCPYNSGFMLDLIQEGNYGMLEALNNFDISNNVKFITYANAWILKYIFKFLEDNDLVKRRNRTKTFGIDVKIRDNFVKKYGYEPSSQEIFDILNDMGKKLSKVEDVEEVKIYSIDNNCKDTTSTNTNDSSELEIDTDEILREECNIDDEVDNSIKSDNINKIMKKSLNELELLVIRKRFGFGCNEEDDIAISYELGISVCDVNNIYNKAIKKLSKYKYMFE